MIGLPPKAENVSGRAFDAETADALDLFAGWWGKARQDRQPQALALAPQMRPRRDTSNDPGEPSYGTSYVVGDDWGIGEDPDVFIADDRNQAPVLYAFGRDEIPLDKLVRHLPAILALLNDPRVKVLTA